MPIETQKFIRKALYVDAVRITASNFNEISAWCQGEIEYEASEGQDPAVGKKYIKVRVHNPKNPRQTKAFVGDWLLYTERGYKVYTNKAFHSSFDKVTSDSEMVEATPKSIAEAVLENEKHWAEQKAIESVPVQEKVDPSATEGKHVLSIEEQKELTADEVKELVQAGEAVLVQDIAQA